MTVVIEVVTVLESEVLQSQTPSLMLIQCLLALLHSTNSKSRRSRDDYINPESCMSLCYTDEFWHGRCGSSREMLGGDRLDTWLCCGGVLGVDLRVGLGCLLSFVRVLSRW